jgi:hypothetical protein
MNHLNHTRHSKIPPCKTCIVFAMCKIQVQEGKTLGVALRKCENLRKFWHSLYRPKNKKKITEVRELFGFNPFYNIRKKADKSIL